MNDLKIVVGYIIIEMFYLIFESTPKIIEYSYFFVCIFIG